MRASVDAILVVREGGDRLGHTLRAVAAQSRPVNRVVIANTSADSTLSAQIETALQGLSLKIEILDLAYTMAWPEIVDQSMAHVFPGGDDIPESSWVWLLRDDVTPHPSALELLALSVESAPMVKIAGPKQRVASKPAMIREMGESITRFGERMALAEREMDQAQYDRLSDVLAVGEAGMLVHAATLDALEGFDDALSLMDGALDLCIRARLAGHRVVVVPRAVVEVNAGLADWALRKELSPLRRHYLTRSAWLYRRLVYAPLWAVLPLALVAIPWSILSSLLRLLNKRPDQMVSEVAAGISSVIRVGPVLRARRVLQRTTTDSWAGIEGLRLGSDDVRKRRAIRSEESHALRQELASSFAQPPAMPALAWLIGILSVISGAVFGRWWGAPALTGGGFAPLPASFDGLWASAWSFVPTQWGFEAASVPADPAQVVFAGLGSITWWAPNIALIALTLAAVPLAGLIAWWGFSQVLEKAWTTALVAGLWALSPSFLVALSEGRIASVLAHLALPWLLGAVITAHLSWQRVGQASVATVLVTAAVPVLWPLIVAGITVVAIVRGFARPLRTYAGFLPVVLVPALVLGIPRFLSWWGDSGGRWWERWGVLFADPGVGVSAVPATWWQMALGWPSVEAISGLGPAGVGALSVLAIAALISGGLVLALALASLAIARPVVALGFAVLFSLGLVTAVGSRVLFSGYQGVEPLFIWPGTGVSVLMLGILVGAGGVLDRASFEDFLGNRLRGPGPRITRALASVVVIFALVAPLTVGWMVWQGTNLVHPAASSRTLPALVAAEATLTPQVGTLIIEPVEDSYVVSIARGAGANLMASSTLVRGRSVDLTPRDEDVARLGAMLVRPSAANPSELLTRYGIRFILVKEPATGEASINLSLRPELVSASAGEEGQLWLVEDVVVPAVGEVSSGPSGMQRLFIALLVGIAILAIPTQRMSRQLSDTRGDGLPALGEDTSDDD